MDSESLFGGSIPLLSKALDLRSKKHNVIVSNIANVDTPDFKAFDLHVEEEMKKFTGRNKSLPLQHTQPGHLPAAANHRARVTLQAKAADSISLRGDGNTVDIDRSMADMAENNILYNVATQLIKKKFEGLKLAIRGGK